MKIARMNPLKNSSTKTVAFFDIQTEEEIVIKGFKLVNGPNGLFASSPDEKRKDGKYYETVTLPKDLKNKLGKMAIEEYGKVKE